MRNIDQIMQMVYAKRAKLKLRPVQEKWEIHRVIPLLSYLKNNRAKLLELPQGQCVKWRKMNLHELRSPAYPGQGFAAHA